MSLLQIKISKAYFRDKFPYFSIKSICCDTSVEPSRRDGANEGSQPIVSVEKYLLITLSGALAYM